MLVLARVGCNYLSRLGGRSLSYSAALRSYRHQDIQPIAVALQKVGANRQEKQVALKKIHKAQQENTTSSKTKNVATNLIVGAVCSLLGFGAGFEVGAIVDQIARPN